MIAPAGQSTARAGLRSKLAALVVRRQAGPATKGLHAPWIPKVEVAEGAGYANAVLLFALNARALCSDLKFGCSPEPPMLLTAAVPAMASALNHCSVGAAYMPPATDRGLSSTGSHPPTSRTLPACFAATSPDGEAFLAGFARAKRLPF